ncbi:hypothetical protein [Calycomorphotria hydatis]|uniref:Uncharacterized protein n=1 Tax=Calycomorphotria hydatis TaxID=2528027 RepID=A0A517T6Q4_9PLAN|nr:hypothetical protein [Calycomorphotria hydatis]QDT64037.1 hypothetical protein V22_12670 [Calycomorphotria hydatis]
MKRTVPLIIAGITGFVLIVAWFIPYAEGWGDVAMRWFNILAAIAFVLGGLSLLKLNLQKISARKAGWGYAAITIVAFLVTLGVGLAKVGVPPSSEFPEAGRWANYYQYEGSAFWWLFEYILSPLNKTMFSLLAFFMASAAYRAFRAKNVEATVLLTTAFVVMLGATFAGVWMTSWLPTEGFFASFRVETLRENIRDVPALAGMRAITIGIALGVVATSLKVLLGFDRSYLGGD